MNYEISMKGKRKVRGVWKFFRGKDKPQKLISLQRFRELAAFLEGKFICPENHGVINLDSPPVPSCPECGHQVDLLPGHVSSGEGLQKDSSHYLRCQGAEGHLFTIRLLPAFPGRRLFK